MQAEHSGAVLRTNRRLAVQSIAAKMLHYTLGTRHFFIHGQVIHVGANSALDLRILCQYQADHSLHHRWSHRETEPDPRECVSLATNHHGLVRPQTPVEPKLQVGTPEIHDRDVTAVTAPLSELFGAHVGVCGVCFQVTVKLPHIQHRSQHPSVVSSYGCSHPFSSHVSSSSS